MLIFKKYSVFICITFRLAHYFLDTGIKLDYLETKSPLVNNTYPEVESPCGPATSDTLASSSSKQTEAEKGKVFVLAPTPAQLGKAPLQRRQSMGKIFFLQKKCKTTNYRLIILIVYCSGDSL